MNIAAFPSGLHRFSLEDLPLQPWANGAGFTREIAAGPPDRPDPAQWEWRFSVADIAATGPFSRFDGIDRHAALLAGEGLSLSARGHALDFNAIGDAHCFDGETALQARPKGDGTRLFNAMSRRNRAEVHLHVHRENTAFTLLPCHSYVFLVASGDFEVGLQGLRLPPVTFQLQTGEGIELTGLSGTLNLIALGRDACALQATASRTT